MGDRVRVQFLAVTALAFWRPYANLNLVALDHRESQSMLIFIKTPDGMCRGS